MLNFKIQWCSIFHIHYSPIFSAMCLLIPITLYPIINLIILLKYAIQGHSCLKSIPQTKEKKKVFCIVNMVICQNLGLYSSGNSWIKRGFYFWSSMCSIDYNVMAWLTSQLWPSNVRLIYEEERETLKRKDCLR